jgi:hypothetical protein
VVRVLAGVVAEVVEVPLVPVAVAVDLPVLAAVLPGVEVLPVVRLQSPLLPLVEEVLQALVVDLRER